MAELWPQFRQTFEALENVRQQHEQRMAPIREMFKGGPMAEMQRTLATFEPLREQMQRAQESIISPETRRALLEMSERHAQVFAQIQRAFPPAPLIPALEVYEVEADLSGGGVLTATAEVVNQASRPKSSMTREQQAAALSLAIALHSYVMDLRRGDLGDAGAGLLVLALLLMVYALAPDPSE